MSDEQLARIESALQTLVSGQAAFKRDLEALREHGATKEDLRGFATKEDLQVFPTRDDLRGFATKADLLAFPTRDDLQAFATRSDVQALPTRDDLQVFTTKDDLQELRQHMNVLHEAVRADIKALGEPDSPTRREMREGFDELKELIGRRLDPLELAVRHHTAELKKLN